MLKRACVVTLLCFAATAVAPLFAARDLLVYFGTYTDTTSKGIYVSRFNPATGALTAPELAAATPQPSFLAITPDARFLYAVNEVSSYGGQPTGSVSAFRLHRDTGMLTALNKQQTGGAAPAHLSVDRDGHSVLVANYTGGSIAVFPIGDDGGLGTAVSFVQHTGKGANPDRQAGPHAHQILTDPRNQFAYVADLGLDKVMIYRFDGSKHTVTPAAPPSAAVKPGAGPRHLTFDASGTHVFVLNEMACTITVFNRDPSNGSLAEFETISSLPPGDTLQKGYSTAEIALSPSGRFLYASTRGHNSITVYSVDGASSRLNFVTNTRLPGKTPRGFGITPDGSYMLVAHQDSDSVVVFRIDKTTGKLAATDTSVTVGKPVDVKFVE
ncbi:MAG TPA: lactonase family protein [Vicinamibacterales bacterium]